LNSENSEPNKTKDSDSEETGDASETSKTGDASKTAGKSEATQTANDAIASSVPVWAMVAGIGLQFVNM
jgi:thiol:disulfide interchange protein